MTNTLANSARIFQFGPFRMRPSERALDNAGIELAIGDRAFGILSVLVERTNEVVTVSEIKAAVWPNLHVEDGVIRVHISALRKLLGAGYIKNVAGRGYCLSADVSTQGAPGAAPHTDSFYRERLRKPPPFPLRLIGREGAIEQILERLREKRFVSIVGPGGVGKTTLALVVCQMISDELGGAVCFVDLSPLKDGNLVMSTVASSFGLSVASDDAGAILFKFIADKAVLIVIDNCEHIIDSVAPVVEQLFAAAPKAHVLTTSREPLLVAGEHLVRVSPLEAPPADLSLGIVEAKQYPAVDLFMERAEAAGSLELMNDQSAGVISDICRKLDGLPLAIELAAARCDTYTLSELQMALDDRVKMLWRGRRTAPSRHQTLEAMIDWSYTLLKPTQQSILAAISVFRGAFRLRAAAAVAEMFCESKAEFLADLQQLVASSLVSPENTGPEPRYRLLDATRAYATIKLENAPFRDATRRRYLHYLVSAAKLADSLWQDQTPEAWIAAHAGYINDIRAGITWAFSEEASETELLAGVGLTAHSPTIWFQLSLTNEYRKRLEAALAVLSERGDPLPKERMLLYISLGYVTWHTTGRPSEMIGYFGKALDIAEQMSDVPSRLLCLWGLWEAHTLAGQEPEALGFARNYASLIDPSTDWREHLTALRMKALSQHRLGDQIQARNLAEEVRNKQPSLSSGWPGIMLDAKVSCDALTSRICWLQGQPDLALQLAEDAAEHALEKKHILSFCYSLATAACPVSLWIGDYDRARYYIERLSTTTSNYGYPHWGSFAGHYARVLDRLTRKPPAAKAVSDRQAHRNPFISELLLTTCPQLLSPDEFSALPAGEQSWFAPELLRLQAIDLLDTTEQEEMLRRSFNLARRQGALSWELRTAHSLAELLAATGQCNDARHLLSATYDRFDEGFDTHDLVAARRLLSSF